MVFCAFNGYPGVNAIVGRYPPDEHIWKTIFTSEGDELVVTRARSVARNLHLCCRDKMNILFRVGIAYEKDISRSRGLPIVIGILKKFTDSIRVEDSMIKFVVDVLDINNLDAHSLLRAEGGEWLDFGYKVAVCNDDVICCVVDTSQIGWCVY